eukprot:1625791-Alexandrium_andersonii.AAC.1
MTPCDLARRRGRQTNSFGRARWQFDPQGVWPFNALLLAALGPLSKRTLLVSCACSRAALRLRVATRGVASCSAGCAGSA